MFTNLTLLHNNSSAERIVYIRELCGRNRKDFAMENGISQNTLYLIENKGHKLTPKMVRKIIEAAANYGLKCDFDWISEGKGTEPHLMNDILFDMIKKQKEKNAIVKSSIDTNNATDHKNLDNYDKLHFLLNELKDRYPESVWFQILDDSMDPAYRYFDYVFAVKIPYSEFNPGLNSYYLIEKSKGIFVPCLLEISKTGRTFNAFSLNMKSNKRITLLNITLDHIYPIILHKSFII